MTRRAKLLILAVFTITGASAAFASTPAQQSAPANTAPKSADVSSDTVKPSAGPIDSKPLERAAPQAQERVAQALAHNPRLGNQVPAPKTEPPAELPTPQPIPDPTPAPDPIEPPIIPVDPPKPIPLPQPIPDPLPCGSCPPGRFCTLATPDAYRCRIEY